MKVVELLEMLLGCKPDDLVRLQVQYGDRSFTEVEHGDNGVVVIRQQVETA